MKCAGAIRTRPGTAQIRRLAAAVRTGGGNHLQSEMQGSGEHSNHIVGQADLGSRRFAGPSAERSPPARRERQSSFASAAGHRPPGAGEAASRYTPIVDSPCTARASPRWPRPPAGFQESWHTSGLELANVEQCRFSGRLLPTTMRRSPRSIERQPQRARVPTKITMRSAAAVDEFNARLLRLDRGESTERASGAGPLSVFRGSTTISSKRIPLSLAQGARHSQPVLQRHLRATEQQLLQPG